MGDTVKPRMGDTVKPRMRDTVKPRMGDTVKPMMRDPGHKAQRQSQRSQSLTKTAQVPTLWIVAILKGLTIQMTSGKKMSHQDGEIPLISLW